MKRADRCRAIGLSGGYATLRIHGYEHFARISRMGGYATKGIPKRAARRKEPPKTITLEQAMRELDG